jgi:hypothetical protein
MMRGGMVAILVACVAAIATGATTPLDIPQQNTLTTIDSVPTKPQLDRVFPTGQALASLSTIAQDYAADTGIRLRAIHALAKYCGSAAEPCIDADPAHTALKTLINATRMETSGSNVLVLRAAIETIGSLRIATDFDVVRTLIDHPSRDIRAATARALRDLCNTQAITPLRVRYTSESTEQVKLAISEALRVLGQCPVTP